MSTNNTHSNADFTKVAIPSGFEYSSDGAHLPIEFYLEVFPKSTEIYLKLGYFSSSAIRVLAFGFAQFIANGGSIKIITNHYLYDDDKKLLDPSEFGLECKQDSLLGDLKWLYGELNSEGEHFLNCLKFLTAAGRVEITPVILKPSSMTHYKQGIFVDGLGNQLFMEGSCNFTAHGLLENGETLSVYRSWGSDFEKAKLEGKKEEFESIANKKNGKYEYLGPESIINALTELGKDLSLDQLLREEAKLTETVDYKWKLSRVFQRYTKELEETLKQCDSEPRFPFDSSPRPYQIEAYENWLAAGKTGVFAMATGTGKTITALNSLLSEFQKDQSYQAVILVPSKVLVEQWYEEARQFNFQNTYMIHSGVNWKPEIRQLLSALKFDPKQSFVIIVTYQTFSGSTFDNTIRQLPVNTILIADEAHNIGAEKVRHVLPSIPWQRRIALSATPKRIYDQAGTEALEEFFDSTEPYTYSFSLDRAIEEGFLCQYKYYPHLVSLNDDESERYIEISNQLARYYSREDDRLESNEVVKRLLLKRKRIIHKAAGKLDAFSEILSSHLKGGGQLRYTFVYVPEGDDDKGNSILKKFINKLSEVAPSVRGYAYVHKTQNKAEVLDNFEKGYFDVLFSMKCLDEGVDIPRAELAIFCSSTGNPRQFIQRRGRVLRKHHDKSLAIIHDLVVVPSSGVTADNWNLERNLLKNELMRVIYFASLASNYYEAMEECTSVADRYGLDVYALQEELRSV